MADLATAVEVLSAHSPLLDRKQKRRSHRGGVVFSLAALAAGLGYIVFHVVHDLDRIRLASAWPLVMLGFALAIALGFELVNGFHDTANAVATVIYTNSLEPHIAVVWSGICNLAGVLVSSGTVAYAVVALLPVELILKVSSGAGFAMVFALLIAAILWNLGTWWLGLPASSSHTLVGSIIGVGIASQLLNGRAVAAGLDWSQVVKVLKALFFSPLLGFALAGLLILIARPMLKSSVLNQAPKGSEPPPWPVRMLMVLTCTGVSFFHGSNDGQKGMGLIMLILIGTVPAAYALNHSIAPAQVQTFLAETAQAGQILERHIAPGTPDPDPRTEVANFVQTHRMDAGTLLGMRQLIGEIHREVSAYKSLQLLPAADRGKVRDDMYLTSEALRLMESTHGVSFTAAEESTLNTYRGQLDNTTKFIPTWVKVAVALALGLGTMIGWRRIVITVGERIGQQNMTYAQGASAGLVTMGTIFMADSWGLPVSTTHILASGVAGTMAANGSGLRWSTINAIAAGWLLTLPAAALLSGALYFLFHWIG